MKFQIGDKVTVLHSNEEAEVVEMINDKMVLVEVRGVKFPAYIDQLDFPYFKRFSEKKIEPQRKSKTFVDQLSVDRSKKPAIALDGCWLRFLPVSDNDEFGDEVVESLKIYLVNHTDQGLNFKYRLLYGGKEDFNLSNEILSSKDFYLHDIPFEKLNDAPLFEFEFSLLRSEKSKAAHYEHSLKLRARPVFLRIEEMKKKGEASFAYKLFERYEVDLHIEKLMPEWKHLSNFEILTIQLNTFEKYLDLAIAHHQHNLVVIHGVGKGKLKDEIHEILKARREVKSFINQYDPRYGYGATEIFL